MSSVNIQVLVFIYNSPCNGSNKCTIQYNKLRNFEEEKTNVSIIIRQHLFLPVFSHKLHSFMKTPCTVICFDARNVCLLFKILDMTKADIGHLARHLGHNARTHEVFYRLSDSTIQLSKVFSLFSVSQFNIRYLCIA